MRYIFALIVISLYIYISLNNSSSNKTIENFYTTTQEPDLDLDPADVGLVESPVTTSVPQITIPVTLPPTGTPEPGMTGNLNLGGLTDFSTLNEQLQGEITRHTSAATSTGDALVGEKNELNIKDSDDLNDMFHLLSNAEQLCEDIDKRQEQKDFQEENKILKKSKTQIEKQQTKINELNEILNKLRQEQARNDSINKKCQSNNQKIINNDYNLVKKLAANKLLKDQSTKVELNLSDIFKKTLDCQSDQDDPTGPKGTQRTSGEPGAPTADCPEGIDACGICGGVVNDSNNCAIADLCPPGNNRLACQAAIESCFASDDPETCIDILFNNREYFPDGPPDQSLIDELLLERKPKISLEEIYNMYEKCGIDRDKYIDLEELIYNGGLCNNCNFQALKEKALAINRDFY